MIYYNILKKNSIKTFKRFDIFKKKLMWLKKIRLQTQALKFIYILCIHLSYTFGGVWKSHWKKNSFILFTFNISIWKCKENNIAKYKSKRLSKDLQFISKSTDFYHFHIKGWIIMFTQNLACRKWRNMSCVMNQGKHLLRMQSQKFSLAFYVKY